MPAVTAFHVRRLQSVARPYLRLAVMREVGFRAVREAKCAAPGCSGGLAPPPITRPTHPLANLPYPYPSAYHQNRHRRVARFWIGIAPSGQLPASLNRATPGRAFSARWASDPLKLGLLVFYIFNNNNKLFSKTRRHGRTRDLTVSDPTRNPMHRPERSIPK